ncbi:hypothetical protein [Arthrobacter castelli]|uniref:hypothetical protein n=1 Tax=Arthrobacter castelli TaxID=271431 RepID=UPI0003FA8329|nr:hypothetical protein [Arthrobacter castelli]
MDDGQPQHQESTRTHGPPPQRDPNRPHRHKPTDDELKSARTFIRLFAFSIILALLTSYLELPWKAAAPVIAAAAVVFSIIGLVKSVRCGFPRLLRVGLALGIGVSLVLTISSAALVALWPITAEYETCMSQALTVSAEVECQQDYEKTLEELSEPLTP